MMASKTTVLIGIPCLLTGGTEIQTLHLVQALVESGYRCVTVCYFEHDDIMVSRYRDIGSEVICLSPKGTRPASNKEVWSFLKEGLKKVVEKYQPQITHVQYMAPGAMPILILNHLGVKNILATVHTDASIYKRLWMVRYLQRRKTKAFLCVSETAEKSFFGKSRLYTPGISIKRHNHFTIYNCLSPETIIKDSNGNIVEDNYVIGFVARLEAIKGADYVIPAFAKLLEKIENCCLEIVGDGKLLNSMKQQQKELGISSEKIHWHGMVPYSQLQYIYDTISLLWVPSRSEGFGLTAIEAMAHGCPVVATRTGGLVDFVGSDENGALFTPGDIDMLVYKTIEILSNRGKYAVMRNNAVNTAKKNTYEKYKEKITDLYSQL
ncbi:MAG: glycosyltransferase family 4 protein [Bacteroidales bacterium]|nr:glycosyltransferase family 4 protein [Bacteroidales bacterium]